MRTFFFLSTKPQLSQAGALLLPKDFVSLSISVPSMIHTGIAITAIERIFLLLIAKMLSTMTPRKSNAIIIYPQVENPVLQ